MRLQVFSDLHLDVRQPKAIQVVPDVDAMVVAGDTCEGAERGFARLRQFVPMQIPIIAVMGNHESYRRCLPDELAEARPKGCLDGLGAASLQRFARGIVTRRADDGRFAFCGIGWLGERHANRAQSALSRRAHNMGKYSGAITGCPALN